ncbi:MAG: biliverdin-producing heme oxygenase [Cyanobacteria bacterium P01_F01_bin.150]
MARTSHPRDALNTLPINKEQATQIVAEANVAFQLNCDMMHGLESLIKKVVGEQVFNRIISQEHAGSTKRPKAQSQRELIAKP